MQESVCLIGHGAKVDRETIAYALESLGIAERSIDVQLTTEEVDACALAREAVGRGVDRIIAVGGDGTVNEVVHGIFSEGRSGDAGARPALGIVPLGTANDLAGFLEIPDDLPDALRMALTVAPRMVDVGDVGGRTFLNVVTGGVMSEASANLHPEIKEKLGTLAYTLAGLVRLPSIEAIGITVSTRTETWSGRVLAIAIGNARTAAGGFELCPDAVMDDGALDLTIIPADIDTIALAGMLLSRSVAKSDQVVRLRSDRFELHADRPINLNADGEPIEVTSVDINAVPRALSLCVPERTTSAEERSEAPSAA